MKTLFSILFLFVCTFGYAGDYICYDTDGRILHKYRSVDGNFIADKGKCLKVNRDTYNALNRWKKVEGGKVVEMTQEEKDAILQAEKEAQTQAINDAIEKFEVSQVEILTALVQVINKRLPSDKQITKEELVTQIKANR